MLRDRSVMVAVTTNKPHDAACAVIEAMGDALPVDAVFGAEQEWPRKPDPAMLHAAKAAGGGGTMVLVGDSVTDRDAAMNAGVPFLAVRGGFNHGGDIADMVLNASMVFDDLHGVSRWLEIRT
jgi:phosphoglycolate phosphatase